MSSGIIPHSKPWLDATDQRAVSEVLESGMLAAGRLTGRFERDFARRIGRSRAVMVSSGTAALYCTLRALGIGEDDEVIIPAYVCSAVLYAVTMCGARPVLADSGDSAFHPDADTIRAVLSPRSRAIVFPHLFGGACDITALLGLGLPVIEDCAQSIGAERNGRIAGSMGSVAAVFSFYATKVMTAGEGGMVLTDDAALADRIRDFIDYADKPDHRQRFNLKTTDLASALGGAQLLRLGTFIERRRKLAAAYTRALGGTELGLPAAGPGEQPIWYRYVVRTDDPDTLRRLLRQRGVHAERPVYTPLSRFPGYEASRPCAGEAWRTALSLPLYPALTDGEAARIVDAVGESLRDIAESGG